MEGRSRRCLYTLAHAEAERYRRERVATAARRLISRATSESGERFEVRGNSSRGQDTSGYSESATAEAVADRDEMMMDSPEARATSGVADEDHRADAMHEWNRLHWWPWAAERYLEHVSGETYWRQFAEHDFDVLAIRPVADTRGRATPSVNVVMRLKDLIEAIRARGASTVDAELVRRLEREVEALTIGGIQVPGDRDQPASPSPDGLDGTSHQAMRGRAI